MARTFRVPGKHIGRASCYTRAGERGYRTPRVHTPERQPQARARRSQPRHPTGDDAGRLGRALAPMVLCVVLLGGMGCEAPPPEGDQGSGPAPTSADEPERSTDQDQTGPRSALVTDVVDGDTVELEGVGRVRLIGVDTPERGEECFDEATAYLVDRVGGQTVRYRYQSGREDRYDRALLDLFRGGELVNLDIAQAGWGEALTIAPNDRYADRIVEAEVEARAEPRGRWAGCREEPEPKPAPTPEPAPEDDDDSTGGNDGGGGVPAGTCDEIGITDFPVAPGDPRDRDGDAIACES